MSDKYRRFILLQTQIEMVWHTRVQAVGSDT